MNNIVIVVLLISAVVTMIGLGLCLDYLLHTPTNPTKQLPIGKWLIVIGIIGALLCLIL